MFFFTADLHLGDDEILARESRPFASIREFENEFVKNMNEAAGREDVLYVIGDWFNYNSIHKPHPSEAVSVLSRISPRVILIMGNGEERIVREIFQNRFDLFRSFCLENGFADVLPECRLSFGGRDFYLNHYPRKHMEGTVSLFGHTHRATGLWKPYGLNVGTDLNHFRPFSETDILDLLHTKEEWWDLDEDCRSM